MRAHGLAEAYGGREVDRSEDAFLLLFDRPVRAVVFARGWHRALATLTSEVGVEVSARVAIHLGEFELPDDVPASPPAERPLEVAGVASRVMTLARGGQTLLTRGAFDFVRRAGAEVAGDPQREDHLRERWLAHGAYLLAGMDDPGGDLRGGRALGS